MSESTAGLEKGRGSGSQLSVHNPLLHEKKVTSLSLRTPLNKVSYPALFWANNLLCSLLTKYEGTLTGGQKFNIFPHQIFKPSK